MTNRELHAKVDAYASTRGAVIAAIEPREVRLIVLHDQMEAIVRTMSHLNATLALRMLRDTHACLAQAERSQVPAWVKVAPVKVSTCTLVEAEEAEDTWVSPSVNAEVDPSTNEEGAVQ